MTELCKIKENVFGDKVYSGTEVEISATEKNLLGRQCAYN